MIYKKGKISFSLQALKKLNFVSTKIAYDRLPALNVNDNLFKTQVKTRPTVKKELSTVDSEPNLANYLKPSGILQYNLELSVSDEDDESKMPRHNFPEDHFHELYEIYQRYFDPLGSHEHYSSADNSAHCKNNL